MNCKAILACEKVIIDKEGAHSLINIILNASIKLQQPQPDGTPRDVDIPSNAVAPSQWWIYTLWEPSLEDVGKTLIQVYEVYWPNGEKLLPEKAQLQFVQSDQKLQQTTFLIPGFPIGQEGTLKVLTWLELPSGERQGNQIETFIRIEHLTGKPEPSIAPMYSANFQ